MCRRAGSDRWWEGAVSGAIGLGPTNNTAEILVSSCNFGQLESVYGRRGY